ncbi:AI-2E family transporter [Novosphingobium sp. 9]|uniref:AI-2E family transporter n=1 Tax=Novosphingobium sp. 9 TaxID=2025349 RepID=UPI0021B684E1|nr:AI-2E family transporter [Novosphingobium sp. 9]
MIKKSDSGFRLEDGGFIALVILVTLGFLYLLVPYFGAVLWGLVAAILFEPLTLRLAKAMGDRRTAAALIVLFGLIAVFIVPAILLGIGLVNEATTIYQKIQGGQIDPVKIVNSFRAELPRSVNGYINEHHLLDINNIRQMFGSNISGALQNVAGRLLIVGQGAFNFIAALGVMLYLTYFLLRNGDRYADIVRRSAPLRPALRDKLIEHFVVVVRATMKGTVVVGIAQGVLGGILFSVLGIEGAMLWGVLMGFCSLLPAVGSGLVWVPMAGYLFVTGQTLHAVIVLVAGFFVIGVVDNVLRPVLVGRDTRMPDFVVLIATLSGLELFGLNGLIVGPVIAALFMATWNLVSESKDEDGMVEPGGPDAIVQGTSEEATTEAAAHPS